MERAEEEGRRRSGGRRRLALFPCPLEGHLNPMLHLATLLHSRGFSITIIHTYFNSPDASDYPDFSFRPIFDGRPDDCAATEDLMGLIADLNVNCEAGFSEQVGRMVEEEPHNPVVCIVSDALMHFTQSVAKRLTLPRIILRTSSITSLVICAAFPILREKGYLPIQDPESDALVSVLPPLRIKDLPNIGTDKLDNLYQLVTNMISETKTSVAVISNSFDSLEPTALSKIRQDLAVPIFPIGPLHMYPSPTPFPSTPTLFTRDMTCMPWLDNHPPTSVVYASLGSLAVMSQGELVEMAWGLANCGHPFLWVVRPSSIRGGAELPEGFEAETAGRGRVVTWAPQREVLAHPAVSVFLTHCGWNSTLESICEGVPMLCWPRFGDQKVNARFVSHVWKVGLQLEEGLDRVKIERGIKRLMVGKEGEEMRGRVRVLKENAELCIREGGSSYESFHKLLDCVLSL